MLHTIQESVFDNELYPGIAMKAAILMYLINRKHIFLNGNKRMSIACTSMFLTLNNRRFTISDDELVTKALEIASSEPLEQLDQIKQPLSDWIHVSTTMN